MDFGRITMTSVLRNHEEDSDTEVLDNDDAAFNSVCESEAEMLQGNRYKNTNADQTFIERVSPVKDEEDVLDSRHNKPKMKFRPIAPAQTPVNQCPKHLGEGLTKAKKAWPSLFSDENI